MLILDICKIITASQVKVKLSTKAKNKLNIFRYSYVLFFPFFLFFFPNQGLIKSRTWSSSRGINDA